MGSIHDGYAATTIDDIAGSARVSKGAVYYHFVDMADLFEAAFRERQPPESVVIPVASANRLSWSSTSGSLGMTASRMVSAG
jgi:AcrR family transcriptional regulator